MRYGRIEEGVVAEIVEPFGTFTLRDMYHPDLIPSFIEVDADAETGMTVEQATVGLQVPVIEEPVVEEPVVEEPATETPTEPV